MVPLFSCCTFDTNNVFTQICSDKILSDPNVFLFISIKLQQHYACFRFIWIGKRKEKRKLLANILPKRKILKTYNLMDVSKVDVWKWECESEGSFMMLTDLENRVKKEGKLKNSFWFNKYKSILRDTRRIRRKKMWTLSDWLMCAIDLLVFLNRVRTSKNSHFITAQPKLTSEIKLLKIRKTELEWSFRESYFLPLLISYVNKSIELTLKYTRDFYVTEIKFAYFLSYKNKIF